jgi:hypothetical protein
VFFTTTLDIRSFIAGNFLLNDSLKIISPVGIA